MISTEKNFKATCDPPYCEIPPGESWRVMANHGESWRVSLIQEILETKHGKLEVHKFGPKELDEIIRCACCT